MMEKIKVFYLCLPQGQKPNDDFLVFLSKERKEEFYSLALENKRTVCEFSFLFCLWIIATELSVPVKNIKIRKDVNGRPYVEGHNINLSLSHSHNIIVLALSNNRIGVDVESINKADLKIAERFYNFSEIEIIKKLSGIEQKKEIIKYLTRKESYSKYKQILFHSILKENIENLAKNENIIFSSIFINNYIISICSTDKVINVIPKSISELNCFFRVDNN